jgi:hypothetical protein
VVTTTPTVARDVPDVVDRRLLAAATFFTAVVLLHGLDHLRRGVDAIDRDVFWAGTAAMVLEVGVVVLVCMRHRWAPLAAGLAGTSLAVGYVVVHFLPERGWLSDSLTSASDPAATSILAAGLEVLAGVALAAAGWTGLAVRGGLDSTAALHPAQTSWREGFLHPVALAMLGGNVVLLAASVAQL